MRPHRKILVVDDDAPIRALLATVLRRRGFQVDTARDGEHALQLITQCRYALMILDLMMPRVSGYDVIEEICRFDGHRPYILLLTADCKPRPLDSSLILGTMHKPFDVEMLVEAVAAALSEIPADKHPESRAPLSEGRLRERVN
jgi:DNA-binding response OmpR family regulator